MVMEKYVEKIKKEYDIKDPAGLLICDILEIALLTKEWNTAIKCIDLLKLDIKWNGH